MDFFSLDNFGKYINIAIQTIREIYKITESNLLKKSENQFFNSEITYNVPQFMLEKKSKTLNDLDEEFYPEPLEIPFYYSNCLEENNCNSYKNFFLNIFNKELKSDIKIFNTEEVFANKINLIISLTKYFVNPKSFPKEEALIRLIKNSIFTKINNLYSKSDLIIGGEDDYIKILNCGSFYENFKPMKKSFSGFPIYLETEKNNNTEINSYSMYTGRNSPDNINLRIISKINNEKIFNFKKKIFNAEGKEFSYAIPLFKGKKLIEASDGFQYSANKNYIFYYDKFSSNIFGFEFKKSKKYNNNIECDFYQLNEIIETPLEQNYISNSSILKELKGKKIKKFFVIFLKFLFL
jgi:hypothetical protein